MSGSGSTVFGIFDSDNLAEQAADTFADCATFVLQL
jgi:4-diphosphocytidyl-2C-methyl-D-erythritol kinase